MFHKLLVVIIVWVAFAPFGMAASTSVCYDITDSNDARLMLHLDTDYTDSAKGKTITVVGGAAITTLQKKWGVGSSVFDGAGDDLTVPDHADWDIGTEDFTVDFQVRFDTVAYSGFLSGTGGTFMYIRYHEVSGLQVKIGGGAVASFAWTPLANTWYHVAVTRASGTIRAFINGTQIGSDTAYADSISCSDVITIGYDVTSDWYLDGWLDEYRIIRGTAVWTASGFAPPTAAYVDCSTINKSGLMEIIGF